MKLKQKRMKQIKGSISILLVLVMLPMMTFAAVIVDLSRINMAKQMVSSAGSLAMNTELANYDTILKDVYGLFAMSQVADETPEDTAKRVQDYFERTLVSYNVVEEAEAEQYVENLMGNFHELLAATDPDDVTDFLRLENITAEASGIPNSALNSPDILRKQIVEYMKYRAPIEFGMSFLDALKSFSTVGDQTAVVEAQVKAQESTQDVTQACQNLITLIREYDILVENINDKDPEQRVLCANAAGQALMVPLEDYDTHMSLLRDGRNNLYYHFQHLNRINLVFLDNNPNVDNVYLKNLSKDTCYIADGGKSLIHDNSGISFTVQNLATDTASAKAQMDEQIDVLNSTYLPFAGSYIDQNFISEQYIGTDSDGTLYFTDEGAAITSFGNFEKFLLNQAAVKYDDPSSDVDVKGTLDEIYRLNKYFENYKTYKQREIDNKYREWQNALGVLTTRKQERNTVKNALNNSVSGINNTTKALYPDLTDEDILTFLADQERTDTIAVLEQLPGMAAGAHWSYYSSNLQNGTANKYKAQFTWLTEKSSVKDSNAVIKAAKGYSGKAGDFESHMKSKAGNSVTDKDEYKLLKCLLQCSEYADTFYAKCSEYDTADQNVTNAQNDANAKEQQYNTLCGELETVCGEMAACLAQFVNFVNTYQNDAYTFGRYIQAARDVINGDIAGIQVSYVGMLVNTKNLYDKQQAILDQIDTTMTAIEAYNGFLDKWEEENNAYITKYGKDSFSKQVEADIKTARSEYDKALFVDLQEFVKELQGRYDAFYKYLTDLSKNKYGHYHISLIVETQGAVEAVEGLRSSESVVTAQMADDMFASLFPATPSDEFDPFTVSSTKQLCFLRPVVVQYQALKYLNSAYPEEENKVDIGLEDENGNAVDAEDAYKDLTDDMAGSDGGSVENTDDVFTGEGQGSPDAGSADKYGYTYKDKSTTAGLPSQNKGAKGEAGTQYNMSKDGDDVNVSGGMSEQTGMMNKVLKNIGSALNAGVENLYILTYIFENFSYNTMVQDAMVELDSKKPDNERILGEDATINAAIKLMGNTTLLEEVKDKVPMLSGGYTKNGKNNYLYGAEVEYILYGNSSAKTNVTYAKSSIYAVRFGFNCIYAFTDSTIRNITMSAGLAVQAATCGIIPYQVVQVVLQLAMAAAESALDLEMMNCGLKVAVVKSKETWLLSLSSAADVLADIAADAVSTGIKDLTQGVQDLVDAGAEELSGAISDLSSSLEAATRKAMEDVMNESIGYVIKRIEEKLNELQYITDTTTEGVQNAVDAAFNGLENQLKAELDAMFAGNQVADKVLPHIKGYIDGIIQSVKNEITNALTAAPTDANNQVQDAGEKLIAKLGTIKAQMIERVTGAVKELTRKIEQEANSLVGEISESLKDYAGQVGADASEAAAEEVRNQVKELANGYIDSYLGSEAGIGAGEAGAGGSLAAAIKFGYKDYLMLFLYIDICVGGENVLLRTADVIQMNLQKAGADAQFTHKRGADFKMSEAYTYVLVECDAELDLLLMDFSIFADVVAEDDGIGTDAETENEDEETNFPIHYVGMLGY